MSTIITAHVGTTAFTIERSALGQVAEYDVYADHATECEGHPADEFHPMGETVYCDGTCAQASDRKYLGGGSKREARAIFNREVRAAERREREAAPELAGDGLPFCSCEVEDDGDGESGPHLSVTRLDEDCLRHGPGAKGAV